MGVLREINHFELIDGVCEDVMHINESGYLCIVVTNQPTIARDEITKSKLDDIHNKMETLWGQNGAYIDGIYYCPHPPDKGFKGEVIELKIDCQCRKPKSGILLKVADDFNIDLSFSWMVGDSENDIKAGKATGCHTALIGIDDFGRLLDKMWHLKRQTSGAITTNSIDALYKKGIDACASQKLPLRLWGIWMKTIFYMKKM